MSASTSPDPRIIRWLEGLANLTVAGSDPVSPERLTLMAGMLVKDGFPPAAFTSDSLHHCTQGHRFFPAYDDVRKALHAWWDAHRAPAGPQIAGPDRSNLSPFDRHWIAFWHKRRREIIDTTTSQAAADQAIGVLASLVKTQSQKAWDTVTGRPAPPAAREPTPEEVSYVAWLLRPEPVPTSTIVLPEPETPPPFRDVTAQGAELARIRGRALERTGATSTDREEWA